MFYILPCCVYCLSLFPNVLCHQLATSVGVPSVVNNFTQVSLRNFICWQFKKTSHVGGTSRKELVKVLLSNFAHIAIQLFSWNKILRNSRHFCPLSIYTIINGKLYISHLSHLILHLSLFLQVCFLIGVLLIVVFQQLYVETARLELMQTDIILWSLNCTSITL